MMSWRKRLKLLHKCLIIISMLVESSDSRLRKRNSQLCCDVIKLKSTSLLSKYYPEHIGSYRLLKNSKTTYKHLSNPNSFIFLVKIPQKGALFDPSLKVS